LRQAGAGEVFEKGAEITGGLRNCPPALNGVVPQIYINLYIKTAHTPIKAQIEMM
jgi:hypothetical protein